MRAPAMAAAALALAVGVLAGCTGIPASSAPQIITSGGVESANPGPSLPPEGLPPFQVVQQFLSNNADSDPAHVDARQYLTASANTRWSDTRVTVVADEPDTLVRSNANNPNTFSVKVPVVGTIDATGSYTPVPTGNGGGQEQSFAFQLKQVKLAQYSGRPQWRIDKLQQPGLLVSSATFSGLFQQRAIYFWDDTEQQLVPVPQYTELLEPDALANWLARSLAGTPPDELISDVPDQTDPSRVSVTVPTNSAEPARILIPGASQLDRQTVQKNLAIELAATLAQVAGIGTTRELTIVDGTVPVSIYGVGTTFTAQDFKAEISQPTTPPELYFVDSGGGIVNRDGQPLPGKVGAGYYDFTSVDLASAPSTEGLFVAGTRLNHGTETLDIGPEDSAIEPVPKLTGDLSRPDWAPGASEVWIGVGDRLYRVSRTGHATGVPIAAAGNAQVGGRIAAVRLSPEGSRVALVIDGTTPGKPVSQVWIGVIARSGDGVQVVDLTPITATGVAIKDVAWNDALKLFAVGEDRGSGIPGVYEVQCDGSRWSVRGTGVIPGEPNYITVGSGQVAVVSASNTIWEQNAGSWRSPHGEETDGTAPIYVH